jgi:protein SCO1/2
VRRSAIVGISLIATATLAVSAATAQPAAPAARPAAGSGLAAGEAPAILRDIGFDQKLGQTVPLDLEVRDESGRPRRLGDYFGSRPVVLSLVYYECPMLCTLTLNGLAAALERSSFVPGREFELVTLSFDARETAPLAAAKKEVYLHQYGRPEAAPGWHFLTADAPAVQSLTRAVGFRYAWDEATRQFAHPSGIVVLTPEGRIARYLYGVEYAPKDLRLAVVEASEGRIGTAIDKVALFCYRYDALRGRYSFMALNLVRAGGLLTIAGMAALIVTLRRRELAR